MATESESWDLTSQLEDYLEAIGELQKRDRVARAKDIAERLGVTRATVTSALRSLSEKGLINYQPYSHITLTKQGETLAQEIIRRHQILSEFFQEALKMPSQQAEDNACRAEHALDSEVIDRLVCFLNFLKGCPRTGEVWLKAFDRVCQGGDLGKDKGRLPGMRGQMPGRAVQRGKLGNVLILEPARPSYLHLTGPETAIK